MRINFRVLMSAIVILACLTLSPGIFAFSATGADNLKVGNDTHDAGIAGKNMRTADANNSEERVILLEIFKSVVNSIPTPKLQKLFQLNKAKVEMQEGKFLAKLSGSKLPSAKSQLRSFVSKYTIDDLANVLRKAKESSDSTISKRATELLDLLLVRWATEKKSIDEVTYSLNMFGRPSLPTEVDYRKMEVLHSYIKHLNPEGKSYQILLDALGNRFGQVSLGAILARSSTYDDANILLVLLMDKWKTASLSTDAVFLMLLDFDLTKRSVFRSGELLAFERYLKYADENADVLSVLTRGFKGEARFAKLAYEAQTSAICPKASNYLEALLLRWKAQGIKPDELLSTKFSSMLSQKDEKMKEYINKRYSEIYKVGPDSSNRKLDGLKRAPKRGTD